jgi:hypothetical protein
VTRHLRTPPAFTPAFTVSSARLRRRVAPSWIWDNDIHLAALREIPDFQNNALI